MCEIIEIKKNRVKKKLLIFVKNPEAGKVKTRIAKTMGAEAALQAYHELLAHTENICTKTKSDRIVYYGAHVDENDIWHETYYGKKCQSGSDLGSRMSAAFKEELQDDNNVILIGSDCGQLSTKILELAFKKLEKHDVVLGPTFDGGYYMIGMRTFIPELFQDIAWSTEKVYPATLIKVLLAGKSFCELPMLQDIDFEEDYLNWKKTKQV